MLIPKNTNEIIVYKSNPCGYCSAAIRFLQEYKEREIKIIDLLVDILIYPFTGEEGADPMYKLEDLT